MSADFKVNQFFFERLKSVEGQVSAELAHTFCELDQLYFPNPWQIESWLQLLFASNHELALSWLENQDRQVIGLGLFLVNLEDSFAHLVKIFIHDDYKRNKLGTNLLSTQMERLKNASVTQFYLEVEATNQRAISLYQELGFKKIHHRKDFYGTGRGADIMELRV